ncbi:hypothetical protein S7S_07645 [Isoalcanivorax pacificus W11-5]|uniref:Neutral ceramidase n=1 Tax=Isoalcanivorax pacificus W11-5 TaxID=391936 RepID=A0A0B4XMT6_9GAMM|nr:neutral/alkaline non-lysosomal ceramidase N-terminal domain-containing protein [Isoalcanivorax pacificus]AJD47945.1 hypothetical protein S7S_07645 [Isoalcanivorax pacificus W11-5]
MPKRRRLPRLRLFLMAVLLGTVGALTFTAWPFLTYPATTLTISRPAPLPPATSGPALAGLAESDITPPIGIPKFGYSAWARPSDGFRTRLKARAFYLHSPGQTPLALVTLDLGAGSRVLHHRVAELIAAHTDVPAHGLSLLVTHTHSGPGQFLDSDFYNVFGSNLPGFDPTLAEFLSRQIADAVIRAYRERRTARFATGQTEVYGFTRNRSLAAWARNFRLDENRLTDDMAYQAVNPTMTMLRVDLAGDDGAFYPAGALTAFSIHGTAIPPFTHPWHADVWHWLAHDVAEAIGTRYETPFTPLHGAFQATHADNSPAWVEGQRGDREARRIGGALAGHALRLFERLGTQLDDQLVTGVGSRELDLLTLAPDSRFGLCERAIVGAATAGAAKGDEVFPISWLPFIRPGQPKTLFNDNCQGAKHWMLSKLQLLLPAERFPHEALIQVVRINDLVLVNLPWEVTLESGNRIRKAVREQLPAGRWRVEISSLANGFFGYATTPEEYSLQRYEGGHTLYGPHTLDMLASQSAQLASDLFTHGSIDDLPAQWRFTLLSRDFWPVTEAPLATRTLLSAPRFTDADGLREPYWAFRFRGEHPAHLPLHEPLLHVEQQDADGHWSLLQDDQGSALQLLRLDQDAEQAEYEVRWYNPPHTPATQPRRFRVLGHAPLSSAAF